MIRPSSEYYRLHIAKEIEILALPFEYPEDKERKVFLITNHPIKSNCRSLNNYGLKND